MAIGPLSRKTIWLSLLLIASAQVSAATAPTVRSVKAINADIQANLSEMDHNAGHSVITLFNPAFRKQMLSEIGPYYKKQSDLLTELVAAQPKSAAHLQHLISLDDARLAFWGDDDAKTRIEARSTDPDKTTATDGQMDQQLIAWWSGFEKPDDQTPVVEAVEALIKANHTNEDLADSVQMMLQTNPASVEIGQRLTSDLCVDLGKTSVGKKYASVPNRMDEPLDFTGTTLKSESFKLSKLRGKVVLVDFWATWCPPCREEIPKVAEVYQKFHDQGLEMIGVSSDNDHKTLVDFLKQHPEMPWSQLFHAGAGWHPLTKAFGITGIPELYLVDRNGNLRLITRSPEEVTAMMPDLLAETYTPAAPAAKLSAGTAAKVSPTNSLVR